MKLKMLFGISVFWATNVWGLNLESAIKVAASEYKVEARYLEAIAHIESSGGRNGGLRLNKNGSIDVGPFQINSVHWHTTCNDLSLVTTLGNAKCAARLVAIAKRHQASDFHWIGRYHSKTPSFKLQYYKKVIKYINKH